MQLTRDVKTLAAAVRPAEHAVRRGGSVKPNCDELDEKTKLSLSRWGGTFVFCYVVSHMTNTDILTHPTTMKFSNKAPCDVWGNWRK